MIKGAADVCGLFVVGVLAYSFGCMLYGYWILFRQAFQSADRRLALKRVWNWQGKEHLMDSRGLRYIYRSAKIGAVVFSLLFIWIIFLVVR